MNSRLQEKLEGKLVFKDGKYSLAKEDFCRLDIMAVGAPEREAEANLEGIGTIKGHMLRIRAQCTPEDEKDPFEDWREQNR
jgi:hypothetical protein